MLTYCVTALGADGLTRDRTIVCNARDADHALDVAAAARGFETRTIVVERLNADAEHVRRFYAVSAAGAVVDAAGRDFDPDEPFSLNRAARELQFSGALDPKWGCW